MFYLFLYYTLTVNHTTMSPRKLEKTPTAAGKRSHFSFANYNNKVLFIVEYLTFFFFHLSVCHILEKSKTFSTSCSYLYLRLFSVVSKNLRRRLGGASYISVDLISWNCPIARLFAFCTGDKSTCNTWSLLVSF